MSSSRTTRRCCGPRLRQDSAAIPWSTPGLRSWVAISVSACAAVSSGSRLFRLRHTTRAELEHEKLERPVAGVADAVPVPRLRIHQITGMQRLFLAVQGPGAIAFDHVLEFLVRMLVRRLQLFARKKGQGGREQAAG